MTARENRPLTFCTAKEASLVTFVNRLFALPTTIEFVANSVNVKKKTHLEQHAYIHTYQGSLFSELTLPYNMHTQTGFTSDVSPNSIFLHQINTFHNITKFAQL